MKSTLALAPAVILALLLTACAPVAPTLAPAVASPSASLPAASAASIAPTPAPAPELTPSQQNAMRSAGSYIDLMGFSRTGLIKQLEFDEYPTADAEIAVAALEANGTADWNAEAVQSAKSYTDFTGFSRQGLIDQLTFDGYTPEQADQAATAVGL